MLYRVLNTFNLNKPYINLLNSKYRSLVLSCNYCSHKLNTVPTENWTTIYKLPYIKLAAAFNKLKIYQGALCTLGIPATFALEQSAHLPESSSIIVSSVGITTFMTLTLGSYFLRNLIGFVYLNDKGDKVRIAFIDFWGKRKHKDIFVDQIMSPMDVVRPKANLYQPVTTRKQGATTYKLTPRFGLIVYPEEFTSIFGE